MKTCPKCGAQADGIFCLNCGAAVNSEPAAAAPASTSAGNDFKEKSFGAAPQQPTYTAPQQPTYQAPQQPYYPQQPVQPEKPGMATAAIVFAFLFPLVGLILGIVGKKKYQTPELKKRCNTAIIISVVVWALSFILQFAGAL